VNFFERQRQVRRMSTRLVILFAVAVIGIIAVVNLAAALAFSRSVQTPGQLAGILVVVSLVTLIAIVLAAGFRMIGLRGGGGVVARELGGVLVPQDTADPQLRRLRNVVEEIAIASGTPVPEIYVLAHENGINAFAAGWSTSDAAVAVTRGALERLNRAELQGVIAHEFSHILNGDMRLNVQLLGVIAGIVLIGSAGAVLMRGGGASGDDRPSRRAWDFRVFLVGLVLWLIGSVGVLAGRLIKAAVSREREFLADASAVQFTRNPDGIGGALYKIHQRGSAIVQRHAEELSHMCIGAPVGEFLEFAWMRTHPPLEERMERLLGPQAARLLKERGERAEAAKGSPVVSAFSSPLYASAAAPTAAALVASIGSPSAAHVDRARQLLEEIPSEVRSASGSAAGARAVVAALLLGASEVRAKQLALVSEDGGEELASQCARLADVLGPLGARMRLPVLTLALPSLKPLPEQARDSLLRLVQSLIAADGKVSLSEFVLQTLLRRYLGPQAKGAPRVRHRDLSSAAREAGIVLSLFAHAGGGGMAAFDKGMQALGLPGGVFSTTSELRFDVVDGALTELKALAPLRKPAFIKACVAVVMADDRLTLAEGELLRAVCAALDSPLPPILETSEAAA
jgi:Zn-dependent protease with chaperone function